MPRGSIITVQIRIKRTRVQCDFKLAYSNVERRRKEFVGTLSPLDECGRVSVDLFILFALSAQ